MINHHRSEDCKPCVFNCGSCKPGRPHRCQTCKAINKHRTADCPTTKLNNPQIPALAPPLLPAPNPPQLGNVTAVNCSTCGAVNQHQTSDCPLSAMNNQMQQLALTKTNVVDVLSYTFDPNARHPIAGCVFVKNGKILLQMRNFGKNAGKLGLVGGEAQGSPWVTAVNEAKEECGLTVKDIDVLDVIERKNTSPQGEMFHTFNFIVNANSYPSTWFNSGPTLHEVRAFQLPGVEPATYGHAWFSYQDLLTYRHLLTWVVNDIVTNLPQISKC